MYSLYPATTLTMNAAAPINSPKAKDPKFECIALKVENKSGLPLPKAKKVTPVYSLYAQLNSNETLGFFFFSFFTKLSDKCSADAIV